MAKFILKRTLLLIPTLWIIITIVFVLLRVVPGTPVIAMLQDKGLDVTLENVEMMEEELGLNDPLIVQYVRYVKDVVTGDWGESYSNGEDCWKNIRDVMEPTMMLGYTYFVLHMITGIPVGVICAVKRNSLMDYSLTVSSVIFMVIPGFCTSLLFMYLFAYKIPIFPAVGYISIARGSFWKSLTYVLLPAISSAISGVAGMARHTRSTMLDVLSQDYIRTARAKGLSPNKIYYKHALKNTVSITAPMVIGSFVGAIGGASILEKVFNQKGMGWLALKSLNGRDYNQESAIVLFTALMGLGTKLLTDIFYKIVDPRIEYE